MNLDSIEELTLLRNCTIIEIIKSQKNTATQETINEFSELFEFLKAGDLEKVHAKLHSCKSAEFSDFMTYFKKTSTTEIASHYLDLAKKLLSPERFKKIESQFKPQAFEQESPSWYLTPEMQSDLDKLHELIKQNNPRIISNDQFRSFAAQFRDITKSLGRSKFQQYFDEQNQNITDMQISYDSSQYDQTVYKTVFALQDSSTKKDSLMTITEPAPKSKFISNYFQNFCYAYLDSHKYANANDSLLDSEVISRKFNTYSECYKKLEEMLKCKINLLGDKVYFSSETTYEPDKLSDFAINSDIKSSPEAPLLY